MKNAFLFSFITIIGWFAGCTPSEQKFSIGEPQTIITQQKMKAVDIKGIDASVYAINEKDRSKWFCTNRWQQVYSIGPRENPFDNVIETSGHIKDLPVPYTDTRLGFSSDHLWGNTSWIANVYLNPENCHILVFVHLEYHPETRGGVYFRMGLAISKDGGKTFQWCGYILEPDLSYETWHNDWYPENLGGHHPHANMGLANYVIKDDYFYLYYTDTKESQDTFMNGMAVARAKIEVVLMAAENHQVTHWNKYHNEKWNEIGMGGEFTPLNIKPLGFLHGDAAYNSYLNQYVIVTRTGKVREIGGPADTSAIVISFSEDGIIWSEWETIHTDNRLHDYPSIISEGDDNEVTEQSFWVYYKYFYDSVLPEIAWHTNRWDRVLITLE